MENYVKCKLFISPEHDGFVLDGVENEALARLDEPSAHAVYRSHGDHKPVLACTDAAHGNNRETNQAS